MLVQAKAWHRCCFYYTPLYPLSRGDYRVSLRDVVLNRSLDFARDDNHKFSYKFLIEESVSEDGGEGGEAVFAGDFFTFVVGAAGVGDADFIDAPAGSGDFGGHFGFDAETLAFNINLIDHFAAEDFVAGFHVGEVEIGAHIAEVGEEFVAEGVPVEEDAFFLGADEAGAIDDVGAAVEDGF